MRATAKITIQMGLLSITNVPMYSAIESGERVSFNQLHSDCHCRVQQKLFCPSCRKYIVDKKVEIVKGYPLAEDNYVILSEEEIEACKKESTNVMKVIQFVENGEIPEIFFESASYLTAEKEGKETFSLFYHLLVDCEKVALAKMVIRQKDHFFALKPLDGILVAYDLYFPTEIRSTDEIEKPQVDNLLLTGGIDKDTIDLAKALVKKMTKPFDREAIKDEYSDALRKIIKDKSEGKVIDVVERKAEKKVVSLKDALKDSLDEAVNF